MKIKPAYIALGANLGDRELNLKVALDSLAAVSRLRLTRISAIYETDPVGGPEQSQYLNACAALETRLLPTEMLMIMQEIENNMGRVRKEHWGPRVIDLDLLVFNNVFMNTPLLQLPHPRMTERDFVLIPLADIAPDLIITGLNQPVSSLLAARPKHDDVKLFLPLGWYV
jgi:2-amino-4-hydroxy-6-hydroxymethyldihydropteridine diphosphokinase